MNKTFRQFKASTCLSLCIACLFLVSGLLVAVAIHRHEHKETLKAAESEAQLILDRNMATHKYFASTLKPRLFELTDPLNIKDYFEPAWMSSTFAIREIEKHFQELNSSGYYYKSCAIDARSPENEADEFEKVFIERLNAEPELQKWSGNRVLDGEEFFVLISRGETMEESCLRCHSTHAQAPGGLVKYYGPDRSFNRKAGEVVSAISIRIPVSKAYAAANQYSIQLILIVIGIMVCVFVILNLINKHFLLTPLDMIRKKASAIAKNPEHLGEEIPLPKGSELKELVGSFNKMSVNLRNSHDYLEDKVKERTRELESLTEELKSVVYIASHDLKSPLLNISGFSGMLEQQCNDIFDVLKSLDLSDEVTQRIQPIIEEDIPESIGFMSASTNKIEMLLDGLLQISRVGTMDVNIEPVDMSHVIKNVCQAMEFQLKEKGAEVNFDDLPACLGDEKMIDQLFSNLIGNALKYFDPDRKGKINITGTVDGSQSIYCVQDNGVGIKTEHQQKIFELFHRINPDDAAGGEGLGLTIVTRILDRNNGSIRVESEEGEGSEFFISLPVSVQDGSKCINRG